MQGGLSRWHSVVRIVGIRTCQPPRDSVWFFWQPNAIAWRFSHNELSCISRLGVSPGLVAAEPGLTPNRLIKATSCYRVATDTSLRNVPSPGADPLWLPLPQGCRLL